MMWRLIIFEVVIVAVIAAVWLLGPLVGIKSVGWRIAVILLLVIPPIVLVVWKLISERRAARGLEGAMRQQGADHRDSVRPDRAEEIQVLSDVFSEAMAALKKSRLGGGGNALYALPWFMIIGPPAVGKSTALLRSGLRFPFTSGDRKSIKGVGGTRNCDWWFSDEAILLDTAGRYTSEDDDLEEWTAFLRMLKRYRKKRPLNGLIVAVSIADILTFKPDELDELAAQVRSRIDHVISELDLALPVYLLFTKCDLVSGFVEYFGDLKKSKRGQILGFTVPLSDRTENIEPMFEREFDTLLERLRLRGLIRLSQTKSHQKSAVFQFPLQFASAREPLISFAAQLLQHNPYQESPRLRGVYFCSGTQEGRPVDRVMAMMSRGLGLRELGAAQMDERATKKSYFLRDLFTKVLVPDRDLAGTTEVGRKRKRLVGVIGLAMSVLVAAGTIALYTMTFATNRSLIKSTVRLAKKSRITTPEDPRKVTRSLKALDRLGERVDSLRTYKKDGAPWSLSLGFYQGNRFFPSAEKVFIKRMRQAFVMPAGSELEATLIDIAKSPDAGNKGAAADFDLLKTYLMVAKPKKRLDVDFAANVLIGRWKKRLHPKVAEENDLLRRNAKRYLRLLKAGRAKWLDHDDNLVRNVRQALRARDAEYRRLIAEAKRQLRPFSLRDALRGRVQTVLKGKYTVPGVYTRNGWTRYIRKRLATQMVSGSKLEPWVLGEEETKNATARLRKRYFEQYQAAWLKFLKGVSVESAKDAKDSLRILEKLTQAPALYKELFTAIAFHTSMPLVGNVPKGASRMIRGKAGRALQAAKRLGVGNALRKARKLNEVERAFLPLKELVLPPKGIDGRRQVSGMSQYLEQLSKVRDQLQIELKPDAKHEPGALARTMTEARRVTKGILNSQPGNLRRLMRPLFMTPLEATAGNAKVAAKSRTSRSFSNEMCVAYKEKLAGRFPFARRAKRQALMQDVIEFFSRTGTVWAYYNSNLKAQLPRRGSVFKKAPDAAVAGHIVAFINRAWRITRAIFPTGSDQPRLNFEVRTYPAILTGSTGHQISEIVLEVEGKRRVYRNGPTEQWSFTWSGNGKRSRLLVRGANGLRETVSYSGDWSALKLFNRGRVRKRGSWYHVTWTLKGGEIKIRMDVRPSRSSNALFSPLALWCK